MHGRLLLARSHRYLQSQYMKNKMIPHDSYASTDLGAAVTKLKKKIDKEIG